MTRSSLLLTGLLLAAVTGLGAADALLVEGIPAFQQTTSSASPVASSSSSQIEDLLLKNDGSSVSSLSSLPAEVLAQAGLSSGSFYSFGSSGSFDSSVSFGSSSLAPIEVTPPPVAPTTPTPPPAGAVQKHMDKDVLETTISLGFTAQDTEEKGLLSAVVEGRQAVTTKTLLLEGDRAGLLVWIETPMVKQVFLVLKESLHTLFSAEVRDLLDETQTLPGKPPRNFLTFFDPAISEERLVFVRVRERLFEFHIAPGKEDAMYKLVEALTE